MKRKADRFLRDVKLIRSAGRMIALTRFLRVGAVLLAAAFVGYDMFAAFKKGY